jgi:hypothetical protein
MNITFQLKGCLTMLQACGIMPIHYVILFDDVLWFINYVL